MPTRDLVFVSYSHHDLAYREKLKLMLKPWIRRGLQFWADEYIQTGSDWQRNIEQALSRARVGVLLVSPHSLGSDFIVERELPPLLEAASRSEVTLFLIAVSASSYEAEGLDKYQFAHDVERPLDTLSEAEQNPVLVTIAKQIAAVFVPEQRSDNRGTAVRGEVQSLGTSDARAAQAPGALHGVPDLPRLYLARPAELSTLKRALLEGLDAALGIVGIQGLGGIGKSVLAAALARDEDVRRAFPDGVYFVAFGQNPELTRLQTALAAELGDKSAAFTEPFVGRDQLRALFKDKACLLILDDLWQHEHALPFDVVGERGRSLVTTRDAQLLRSLGARVHDLGLLDLESALQMLAAGAGSEVGALPPAAHAVAKECGYLPLALTLAAAQVRDGNRFEDVLAALERGRLEFLDHPYGSVWKSLGASVRALGESEAARYLELAVVPEDTEIPASVIIRWWRAQAGLEGFESNQLLVRLANKGLLYLHERAGKRSVSFHDLQLDYLRLITSPNRAALHASLLDAVAAELPRDVSGAPAWFALDRNEQYLWHHLGEHLLAAGRGALLESLVCDVRWLQAKLVASGVAELLRELVRAIECAPSSTVFGIERALRLESGWLYQDPGALPGLLFNRLRSSGLDANAIAAAMPGLAPPVRLRHPVRMDAGELQVFRGHGRPITSCAYSPDGERVLSGSEDHTLREWDARSGQELRRFEGHSGWITSCAYSSDGARVLSGSDDQTLREWDARSGRELTRFEGHLGTVTSCAYGPDGTRVLSGSDDKTLREWDARSGQELRRFEGHSGWVTSCAYSPDGARVLSGCDDGKLREWDVRTGQELRRFEGHSGGVTSCAYSPCGARVLSASRDETLRVWDIRSGKELRRYEGHSGWVCACAFSPDGGRVLSGSDDKTLREWDVHSGNELTRSAWHRRKVTSCAYSPDGARVLSGSRDWTLREWDVRTGQELRRYDGQSDAITSCAYSPDGKRVLSGSQKMHHGWTLREWDVRSGEERMTYDRSWGGVTCCTYSPNGSRVLAGSNDRALHEWNAQDGRELSRHWGHSDAITSCAYSPDGVRVLSGSNDGTVREWYLTHEQERIRFEGHSRAVTSCAYRPDGGRVLSGAWDNTLREWDARSGQELRRFEGQSIRVTSCGYSPDGRLVVAASDERLIFWSTTSGNLLYTVYGVSRFECLALAEGELAAGDEAGNLWLLEWDELGA
ncbi:MAG TPA: NB-ARC domain-containing protein [Polyangiaceae bacterium]|nr:NB-ARC domain-containing protein [Polyangiaceae bacterium]